MTIHFHFQINILNEQTWVPSMQTECAHASVELPLGNHASAKPTVSWLRIKMHNDTIRKSTRLEGCTFPHFFVRRCGLTSMNKWSVETTIHSMLDFRLKKGNFRRFLVCSSCKIIKLRRVNCNRPLISVAAFRFGDALHERYIILVALENWKWSHISGLLRLKHTRDMVIWK